MPHLTRASLAERRTQRARNELAEQLTEEITDNNRKPIARLHFNAKSQWYVGTFDADKKETRHPINDLEDIYAFADIIRFTVRSLEA